MSKHPMQPLVKDEHGTVRFKANAIVRHLLDLEHCGMNKLAALSFPREDRVQFAQLIGYSLGGFGELGYVSSDDYSIAARLAEGDETEAQARIAHLEAELEALRASLREPMARLYGKHPDDLAPVSAVEPVQREGSVEA